MNDIRMLIEQQLKDFIDFLAERKYFLLSEKEHSRITFKILQELINEYMEKI